MSQPAIKEKQEKVKNTPWTNIGIKVDLCSFLTRKVLTEKFSPQKAKKIEMRNFFISKIDGCELYVNDIYPDYIFYIKNINGNNEILMEKSEKNKTFYIKYTGIWSVFESLYLLEYSDIQSFTQIALEELLKLQGYKTLRGIQCVHYGLEELLKLQGYKTRHRGQAILQVLEELLKLQGYKTDCPTTILFPSLEDGLKSND